MTPSAIVQSLIRTKTLIASISPVLLSASLALKKGCFQLPLFCLLLSTALMLQILSNIANDYFDGLKGTDSAGRIGPQRMTASGILSENQMKKILITVFGATLLLGLCLSLYGGPLIASIFGIALILAILYTAGPFPLSYKGMAEPFAFSFFGPIPSFFAYYMFSKTFSFTALLLGCLPGLYSLILITINNLRDMESDSLTGKKTLVVRKGRRFGKWLILGCLGAQIVLTLFLSLSYPKMLFSLIVIPEALSFYAEIKKAQRPGEFAPMMGNCAKLYGTCSVLWICFIMI